MAEYMKKVFFSILGSCLGMLGGVFVAMSIDFNFSPQIIAMLSYLSGMAIGCTAGFLLAVWWEWERKLKLRMFVAGVTIAATLAFTVFLFIILQSNENGALAFWTAFLVVNLTIPALGIAIGRVSNIRLHKDRS